MGGEGDAGPFWESIARRSKLWVGERSLSDGEQCHSGCQSIRFVFILIQPMKLVGLKKGERPVSTLDSGGGLG